MAQLNRSPIKQDIPEEVVVKNKGGRPTNRSRAGRPTVMTKDTLNKLQEAYLLDCTDEEACFNANISMATLYNYQKDNPEFIELKRAWKQNPFLLARRTLVEAVQENPDIALKYMKNKKNKEFNERQETDVTSGGEKIGVVVLPARGSTEQIIETEDGAE